ncbi:MAG: Serine/threonine-protein kinase 24 [Marteilia pararefringens]
MMTELTALCTLRSPYIIEYHTSFSEGFQLWIVMEYMNYGSISDLIKSDNQGLAEKYCRYIAHKICLALEYLNDNNVLHRDIKSANVLIAKDGSIKLADFGVAGSLSRTVQKRKTLVGTPFWMAPEVIQQDNYDQKADIWALGITCYEMINRHPPHYTQSAIRAIFAIVNSDPPEISENFSTQFRHFVACCLNKNPDKRLSIDELLKHPWFAKKMRKNVITELIVSIEKKKMKKKKGSATRDSVDFSDDDQKNNQIIKSNEIDSHISKEDTVIFPMDFNINKERENNSDKQSKITTQIIHTDQAKDPNNQDKESDNRIINNVPDPVKQINRQYLTNSNDAKFHLDTKSRMHSYYDKPNNAHKKVQQPIKQPTRERINSSLDTGTVRDKKLRYTIDEQYKITPKTNNSNDDQPSSSPINIASRINNLRVSQLTNLNNSQPPSGSPYVSRVSHYYNRARGEIHPSSATKSAADSHQIHLKQLKKVIKRYQLYTQVHNSEKDDPTNVLNELVTTSSNETLDTFESILKDIREEFE